MRKDAKRPFSRRGYREHTPCDKLDGNGLVRNRGTAKNKANLRMKNIKFQLKKAMSMGKRYKINERMSVPIKINSLYREASIDLLELKISRP